MKAVQKQTRTLGGWVKKNSGQFKAMGVAIAAMGAGALIVFKKMVKQYMQTGDMIHKMAIRTGFAAETLSELAYAAEISGADITMLEKGIKKMATSIGEANLGLKTYTDAFALIGIEVKELQGLNPEGQFMKMAAGIAAIVDPTQRAYAAQKLLGRAGTMLLPLFAEGSEGMKILAEDAHRLGIIFDEEAAAKAAALTDAQTALKGSVQGLSIAILNDLIPVITDVTKGFTDFFVTSRTDAQSWTNAILDFFKLVVQGVEGLMLAWHGMQVLVFKGAEFITKAIKFQIDALMLPIKLLAKLPGYGILAKNMLKMVGEHTADLTTISEGYNEAAAEQIEKLTNIVFGFDKFIAVLDKLKTKTKEAKTDQEALGDAIEEDGTLKARDFHGALKQVVSEFRKVRYYGTEAAEEIAETWEDVFYKILGAASIFTSQLGALFDQITTNAMARIDREYEARKEAIENSLLNEEEKAEALERLDKQTDKKRRKAQRSAAKRTKAVALMDAIVGTAAAVVQAMRAPFPLSLILPAIIAAMGAVQIALIAAQPLPALAKGGRIGAAGIVGEEGPELFMPETPGTIMPLRGEASPFASGNVIHMTFLGPLISTTGVARADLERAGSTLLDIIELQARRRGYTLNGA